MLVEMNWEKEGRDRDGKVPASKQSSGPLGNGSSGAQR